MPTCPRCQQQTSVLSTVLYEDIATPACPMCITAALFEATCDDIAVTLVVASRIATAA